MQHPEPVPLPRAVAARQGSLRRHNLGLVLRQVLDAPAPVSRADVAARTGLTRATVSALVDRLVAAGMVAELSPEPARRAGRPAVPLAPARRSLAAVGLEVNVSYLGARALDLSGEVLADRLEPGNFAASDPDAVLARLAALTGEVVAAAGGLGARTIGAGLALPGLVDADAAVLRLAPNLGWRDVDLGALLGRPPFSGLGRVELGNEAGLAARAEVRAHALPAPSFLYVSGEVGIGGAVVSGGRVWPGRRGWSGEFGHLAVEPAGPRCACGAQGCLERYAGREALMTAAGLEPDRPVGRLLEALDHGDPAAGAAVARAGWALGVALAGVVNVTDVDEIALGGIYAPLAAHLAPALCAQLEARVLSAPWSRPSVRPVHDGLHAAMTGAALAVLERLVQDPAGWATAYR